MYKHFIILGSSYNTGKRIALDYKMDNEGCRRALNFLDSIKNKNYNLSTHTIATPIDSFDEIRKIDSFFENVQLVESEKEFLKYLDLDKEITPIELAKYILTKIHSCGHTKLEKLVYFCYADYLCKYNKKLFQDEFYAYKYGPVSSRLYAVLKRSDSVTLPNRLSRTFNRPFESRILNSEDGVLKLHSIETTLDKYMKLTKSQLVELTHRPNTPWDKNGRGNYANAVISDDDILKYHKYEEI